MHLGTFHLGIGFWYLHLGHIWLAGLNNSQKNIIPATINKGQKTKETMKTTKKSSQSPHPEPFIWAFPSYPQFGQLMCLTHKAKAIRFSYT